MRARDFGRKRTFLSHPPVGAGYGAFNDFLTDAATRYAKVSGGCRQDLSQNGAGGMGRRQRWWAPAQRHLASATTRTGPGAGRPNGEAQARPDNEFSMARKTRSESVARRRPIRRTNPRESFEAGSKRRAVDRTVIASCEWGELSTRAGSGDPIGGSHEPGLLFMCLNADIERQFEFIQQTWVMARLVPRARWRSGLHSRARPQGRAPDDTDAGRPLDDRQDESL